MMNKYFSILFTTAIMTLASGQIYATQYCCEPYEPIVQAITQDLTSKRYNALPMGTLQLTAFYDGSEEANLGVQLRDAVTGEISWILVQVPPFGLQIPTWEFDIMGKEVTGLYHVGGVEPNGVVDGLAFGVFWRDDDGNYHHQQSNNSQLENIATYVSAWPLGLNDPLFNELTPQLTDGFGREQARMMLYGAKLLSNGCYKFDVDLDSKLPGQCRMTEPKLDPASDDFTSNRSSAMPNGTLQVTSWYDGRGIGGRLGIELIHNGGDTAWIDVKQVPPFGLGVTTFEYDITGYQPTGNFIVKRILPNGVIDGLAFGLFWKDDNGNYHHIQSVDATPAPISNYVGAWPIGLNDSFFADLTPQLTSGYGREQARMMLYGAKYLTTGCYKIPPNIDSLIQF
jgi:hypothetical protein